MVGLDSIISYIENHKISNIAIKISNLYEYKSVLSFFKEVGGYWGCGDDIDVVSDAIHYDNDIICILVNEVGIFTGNDIEYRDLVFENLYDFKVAFGFAEHTHNINISDLL